MGPIGQGVKRLIGVDYILMDTPSHSGKVIQHFRHYLLGNRIVLRTDHHSLKWLQTFKRPEGILARWMETLAEFDFVIEHRPGRLHSNSLSHR